MAVFGGSAVEAVEVKVLERSPSRLEVRLLGSETGALYRLIYEDDRHRFVWENLNPGTDGVVSLADDKYLRPEYRLRCESRSHPADPVVFDDLIKGEIVAKKRLPFGVPVSTFGGAGYLVPGVADLKRDGFGNCWLYLDHPPYALLKYGPGFRYQFALLLPAPLVDFDLDGDGDLYILHQDNWISKHGSMGERLGAWELPQGRNPGGFVEAAGLVIDREAGFIYFSDAVLGRVQRFDLDLELRPLPFTLWGWIGREEMAYTRAGEYKRERMYYLLDRPRQLALDGGGHLLVGCEHWISKFDLATGRQAKFGNHAVLGWGETFADSPFTNAAGLDGHWQRYWLAGVDGDGNVYVADRENEFVVDRRLQVFGSDGGLIRSFDLDDEVLDESGARVFITAARRIVCMADAVYLVDAAGRIYRSPSGRGIASGGELFLGPGAAGRQVDLSQFEEGRFTVEAQSSRVKHRFEGALLTYASGRRGTINCEVDGSTVIPEGHRSMWAPARIGEPFNVVLFDSEGQIIPEGEYRVQFEEKPGLFGTQYDYFRVTNRSGHVWKDVRFIAEATD